METTQNSPHYWYSALLFQKILPILQLAGFILPFLILAFFTFGMTPENPNHRLNYILGILVVMPVCYILGAFLERMLKNRRNSSIILILLADLTIICVLLLLILWFMDKWSLFELEEDYYYVGWHWYQNYQQRLFSILLALLGFRASFSLMGQKIKTNQNKLNSILFVLPMGIQYIIAGIFRSWITLFVISGVYFCFSIIFLIGGFINDRQANTDENQMENQEKKQEPSIETLLTRLFTLILSLIMGIYYGMMAISTQWSSSWISLFGWTAIISSGLFFIEIQIRRNNDQQKKIRAIKCCVAVGCTVLLFMGVQYNLFQPASLIWIFGLSIILTTTISFLQHNPSNGNLKFRTLLFTLALILFGLVGFGGGIAFYHYQPLGLEIVQKILIILLFGIILICITFNFLNFWPPSEKGKKTNPK